MNAAVERQIELNKGLVFGIVEIERVTGRGRIVALAHQIGFGVLERAGDVQLFTDAQE